MLTDRQIRQDKPRATRFKMADGDGLHLLVMPSGARSWRFRRIVEGREVVSTLQPWVLPTLAPLVTWPAIHRQRLSQSARSKPWRENGTLGSFADGSPTMPPTC